ncbi:MAG: site-2 protease family protein, partial [Candidatus Harrisonbacteria bacterium]|nr:site-2 protease family protein [Candidatus Harrisonbacteria bacterium]
FSVIVHEVSHGVVALRLGDTTARDAGRLTLNPLKHLEFFGSFIVPLLIYTASGGTMIFGWARPVPYDPRFLKNPKIGAGLIAAAGPLSNIAVAIVFALFIRFAVFFGVFAASPLLLFFHTIVLVNLLLAIFNLVPLPPLDGSKVLFALLPERHYQARVFLERYGFTILLLFIFFGFRFITPIVYGLYQLLVGGTGLL